MQSQRLMHLHILMTFTDVVSLDVNSVNVLFPSRFRLIIVLHVMRLDLHWTSLGPLLEPAVSVDWPRFCSALREANIRRWNKSNRSVPVVQIHSSSASVKDMREHMVFKDFLMRVLLLENVGPVVVTEHFFSQTSGRRVAFLSARFFST